MDTGGRARSQRIASNPHLRNCRACHLGQNFLSVAVEEVKQVTGQEAYGQEGLKLGALRAPENG